MFKRKLIFFISCVLCFAMCLGGCAKKTEYTAEELCDAIVDIVFDGEQTTTVSEKEIQNYFSFDSQALLEYKVVLRTQVENYNIVATFRPDGEKNAQKIVEGINQTVSASANLLKSLSENEYKKINNRLLYEIDGIYILIVADDYGAAIKYLDEIGAKQVK